MTKKNVSVRGTPSVEMDMTAEEEAQKVIDDAETVAEKEAFETARTEKANLKASAKAKLIAGEALTEDEADTIVL